MSIRLRLSEYVALSSALAAAVACLAMAPPSSAGTGVVDVFGGPGNDAGSFDFPGGMAVNEATGDVYVADVHNNDGGNRIQQFTADGDFIRAWGWGVATGANVLEVCTASCLPGIAGSGEGQLSLEFANSARDAQIAIDQSDGSVYIADTLNNRVQKFSAAGAFLAAFGSEGTGDGQFLLPQGIAVDPLSGDVFVGDSATADGSLSSNRVQRFSSTGVYEAQVGVLGGGSGEGEFIDPARLGVDSAGRLYVFDRGNGRVQRFTAAGAFEGVVGSGVVGFPVDVTVDLTNDHVFIAGYNADFTGDGIFEFDATGQSVDVHMPNSGVNIEFIGGLAVRASAERVYAVEQIGRRVLILDDVAPPTVAIDQVTEIGTHSATFQGAVNPQGPPATGYRFEVSTDGVTWTCVPDPSCARASDVAVGEGGVDIPVSQTTNALDPNTEYRVRLVATRAFNAASATSPEATFRTNVAPPLVRSLGVGGRTTTAASLGGEVNPQNSATEAHVEYTLASDVAFADSSRVPIGPDGVDVGAGNEFVRLFQLATDLEPGTDYRFRIVATNAAGTSYGPVTTFRTRAAAPAPPPGRRYEMVSPQDKNGSDVNRNLLAGVYATSGASASGDAVAYASLGQFAGIGSGAPQGQYRSVRGPNGWTTRGTNPPILREPNHEFNYASVWYLSEDLSRAVVGTNYGVTQDTPLLGGLWGLYLQDITKGEFSYELLSAPAAALPLQPPLDQTGPARIGRFSFAAASRDMSHVVFESNGIQLTPDGRESSDLPGAVGLYEWANGQVRFVSKLPSGEPADQGTVGALSNDGQFYPGDHPVSDDGQRIYFTGGGIVPGPLYVREHGANTRLVSASERTGDDPQVPRPATFQAAKATDGSLALFTSLAKLTDDATACDSGCPGGRADDLYLWDVNAPLGQQLRDLTVADPGGGGVLNVVAVADDMSHVYFVATGALADGAVAGQPNLYVWTSAQGVRHITTLSEQDTPVWGTERDAADRQFRDVRVSADGARVLFASRARLTSDDNSGTKQVYVYDSAAERLTCVSCPQGDSSPSGDSWLFFPPDLGPSPATDQPRMPLRLPRNLSANGKQAFFETAQGLVPADINGKTDVYLWADGELSLISTGKGDEHSELIDASASGDNVFFTTRERLVSADGDNQVDVYDAHVGPPSPEPKLPPACVGSECQEPFSERPTLPSLLSGAGTGDARLKRPSLKVKRLSAGQRRALAVGRRVLLAVRVNQAGRISVRLTARVGKRARVIAGGAMSARRAGRVQVDLRLSKAAREAVTRAGRLRATLRVRFDGVLRERTVLLVRPVSKGGAR